MLTFQIISEIQITALFILDLLLGDRYFMLIFVRQSDLNDPFTKQGL